MVLLWWLLNSSIGRIGLAALAMAGGLWVLIERAENRGEAQQAAKQERVDTDAKARADAARKKARAQLKARAKTPKKGPVDAWQRD